MAETETETIHINDLECAAEDLSTIPYFPVESRASVMRQLALMCPSRAALRWTVGIAVARCPKWPGMAEIRGLLCSRFDAADGLDQPDCHIAGFTRDEQEARYLEKHEHIKTLSAAQDRRALANLRMVGDGKWK